VKSPSAHDIVAFACVELNVAIPFDRLYAMSPTDPLYKALINAWKEKEKRADFRTALICSVLANCMGGGKKKYEPKDFMPKNSKSTQDSENDIKANFIKYNEVLRSK
jgi:hypothetical protein